MILTKEVELKVANPTLRYYKELGYDVRSGDIIIVPIHHLMINSNTFIKAKCDICDNEKDILYNAYNRYIKKSPDDKYRCNKCIIEIKKVRNIEKYGVEHYSMTKSFKEKRKSTILIKYGIDHYNKLSSFKEKIKTTNIERYGVEYVSQNKEIKSKSIKTNIERYGVTNPLQNSEILSKSLSTMNDRYGVTFSMQSNEIKEKIILGSSMTKKSMMMKKYNILEIDYENNNYILKCDLCNDNYNITPHVFRMRTKQNTIICTHCNIIDDHTSGKETILLNLIREFYKDEIILNSRSIIAPYELDIFIPKLKIAFEFNGIYWHSDIYKDRNYHKNKSDMCESIGVQLIHIWEDDILYKYNIIKSIIINKLGKASRIFARKCSLRIVDTKLSTDFLNKNHLQGAVGSAIKIGLFYNEELVSIMTFGKKRKIMNSVDEENKYELLRFCNKLDNTVIGGASKIFNYFINNFNPIEVISYADRSHSNGNLYTKLGFNFISKTDPNYYYVIDGVRKHRFSFRKDILVKNGFDENKSESQIMIERGINRIYNAGNLKFTYTK
jgi:very-short-patch-repair endonuclease